MTGVLGWLGCTVLVISLAQSDTRRLRALNLVASVILVAYNAAINAVPQVAMNAVLVALNLWQLLRLGRRRVTPEAAAGGASSATAHAHST